MTHSILRSVPLTSFIRFNIPPTEEKKKDVRAERWEEREHFYIILISYTAASHRCTLHYITLHYTTLHHTTLLYTTPHYTTLHYTARHCSASFPYPSLSFHCRGWLCHRCALLIIRYAALIMRRFKPIERTTSSPLSCTSYSLLTPAHLPVSDCFSTPSVLQIWSHASSYPGASKGDCVCRHPYVFRPVAASPSCPSNSLTFFTACFVSQAGGVQAAPVSTLSAAEQVTSVDKIIMLHYPCRF